MPAPGGDRTDQSAAQPPPPALLRCSTHTHMHSPGAKHTAPESPTRSARGGIESHLPEPRHARAALNRTPPALPPPSRLASLPQKPATLPALTHERRQSRSLQNPQRPGWDVGATPVAITAPGIRAPRPGRRHRDLRRSHRNLQRSRPWRTSGASRDPPKPAAPGVGRRSDASRDHDARNPHHPKPGHRHRDLRRSHSRDHPADATPGRKASSSSTARATSGRRRPWFIAVWRIRR